MKTRKQFSENNDQDWKKDAYKIIVLISEDKKQACLDIPNQVMYVLDKKTTRFITQTLGDALHEGTKND